MNEDRIITPTMVETDREIEQSLRPRTIDEYIGQEKLKEKLKFSLKLQSNGMKLWIMYCYMDRRGWVRRLWPA